MSEFRRSLLCASVSSGKAQLIHTPDERCSGGGDESLEVAWRDVLGFRCRHHAEPRLVTLCGDVVEDRGEMHRRRAQTLLACTAR